MLNLAKIQAGQLTLERRPFSLRELLQEELSLQGPQASAKQLHLSMDVAPQVPGPWWAKNSGCAKF